MSRPAGGSAVGGGSGARARLRMGEKGGFGAAAWLGAVRMEKRRSASGKKDRGGFISISCEGVRVVSAVGVEERWHWLLHSCLASWYWLISN